MITLRNLLLLCKIHSYFAKFKITLQNSKLLCKIIDYLAKLVQYAIKALAPNNSQQNFLYKTTYRRLSLTYTKLLTIR